jgi:hypothetical protein
MVDEVADPLSGIAQVDEHRALDALASQRAPEALDLAQRLRPPRSTTSSSRTDSSATTSRRTLGGK